MSSFFYYFFIVVVFKLATNKSIAAKDDKGIRLGIGLAKGAKIIIKIP
jgi:hypothetical protein